MDLMVLKALFCKADQVGDSFICSNQRKISSGRGIHCEYLYGHKGVIRPSPIARHLIHIHKFPIVRRAELHLQLGGFVNVNDLKGHSLQAVALFVLKYHIVQDKGHSCEMSLQFYCRINRNKELPSAHAICLLTLQCSSTTWEQSFLCMV